MSVMTVRGGVPYVLRETINTTGREIRLPFICNFFIVRAITNPALLFFSAADFAGGTQYVTVPVPAAVTPHGEWAGPVEQGAVWIKGSGGNTTIELVAFQRRG